MLTMDEPDHTRLRSIVDEAFPPRAIVDNGVNAVTFVRSVPTPATSSSALP